MRQVLAFLSLLICHFNSSHGSHFFGGTIRWKGSKTDPRKVHFDWSMGWSLGKGPCGASCSSLMVGQLVSKIATGDWVCAECKTSKIAPTSYTLTGLKISTAVGWEQGESSFDYSFAKDGTYTVFFEGTAWRTLNYISASKWRLQTKVTIGQRSDTGLNNRSPGTKNSPIYNIQHGCNGGSTTIVIPLLDDDGDDVTCRWATGTNECGSACNGLPDATLQSVPGSCIIKLDTTTKNYVKNGWYAAALTIEDSPKTTIKLASQTVASNQKISSIPLQFLVHTPFLPSACTAVPSWTNETPANGHVVQIIPSDTVTFPVYARSYSFPTVKVTSINVNGPAGLQSQPLSGVSPDKLGRNDVVMKTLQWTPSASQLGSHSLCFQAFDTTMKSSEYRCVTVQVVTSTLAPTTSPSTTTTSTTTTQTSTIATQPSTRLSTQNGTTAATPGAAARSAGSPMSVGTTSGIAVGLVALIALAALLAVLLLRRGKKAQVEDEYRPQVPPASTNVAWSPRPSST